MEGLIRGSFCIIAALQFSVPAQDLSYRMTNNFVVVEAEDLAYSTEFWRYQDGNTGFSGDGWLQNGRMFPRDTLHSAEGKS